MLLKVSRSILGPLFVLMLFATQPLEAAWGTPVISSVPQTTVIARTAPYVMLVKGKNFHHGSIAGVCHEHRRQSIHVDRDAACCWWSGPASLEHRPELERREEQQRGDHRAGSCTDDVYRSEGDQYRKATAVRLSTTPADDLYRSDSIEQRRSVALYVPRTSTPEWSIARWYAGSSIA